MLLPWEDTNIIINAVVNNEDQNQDIKNIVEAIKNKDCVEYIKEKEDLHAEMKIVTNLCKNGFNQDFLYIGISKLTCAPCQLTIDFLNKSSRFNGRINICGTHGGTYKC